ncbi:MAG: hypothetical protein ACXWZS_11250 [Gemmatirosa sp.]
MTRRAMVLWAVAVLFFLVNVFGAAWAAWHAEMMHTGLHVALLIPSAWLVWRYAPRRVPNY